MVELPFPLKTEIPRDTRVKITDLHPDDHEMFPTLGKIALEEGWYLQEISLPTKNQGAGIGTKIMEEITLQAKKAGKHLFLQAYPTEENLGREEFEKEQIRLMAFYARFGLAISQNGWMFLSPTEKDPYPQRMSKVGLSPSSRQKISVDATQTSPYPAPTEHSQSTCQEDD